jgi:heptosyltransferase-2
MQKILLVQTSFLGDVVLSTPLINRIHEVHPGCELWIMTTPLAAPIVSSDPLVKGVITFDKRGANSGLVGILKQARLLRAHGFDLSYSLHRSGRTSLVLRLSGIPQRIGFAESRLSFLYTEKRERNIKASHDVLRNLSLIPSNLSSDPEAELRVFLPGETNSRGESYVVIAPGSVWRTKQWRPEGFRDVGLNLSSLGYKIVVVGAKSERAICEEVCRDTGFINRAGETSIEEMMRLIKNSALLVCNDSFPLHLGSAFKTPTVAIFCATVPEFGFGPWRNKSVVVEEKGLPCRPCGRHGGDSCPTGTELCMKNVSASQVYENCKILLNI